MEVRDMPRQIEGWEFQELLRQLADSKSEVRIPQLNYFHKRSESNSQQKTHILSEEKSENLFMS